MNKRMDTNLPFAVVKKPAGMSFLNLPVFSCWPLDGTTGKFCLDQTPYLVVAGQMILLDVLLLYAHVFPFSVCQITSGSRHTSIRTSITALFLTFHSVSPILVPIFPCLLSSNKAFAMFYGHGLVYMATASH